MNPKPGKRDGQGFGHLTSHLTTRIFLWRVLSNGFFTTIWAFNMDLGDGIYMYCFCHFEYVPHIFLFCDKAQDFWSRIVRYQS